MEAQMKLEHEIDFHWLILFALPTFFSSIFANLYTTVDGIFVAQWVNTDALSAILSFCRTMVFMVIPVLVLPRFFEMDGVWMALAAGEILSVAMSIFYFIKYRAMWQTPKAAAAS